MTRSRELAELATAYDTGTPLGMRNRIINGDMRIDQRNAGATVNTDTALPVDRFKVFRNGGAATFTAQRSTTAPAGFTHSLLYTVGTGAAPGASDYSGISQAIEGFNVADLGWGTADAKPVTLSFLVRSSVTGTFGFGLRNGASNRSYIASYTVAAADTWETKTVTIPGDTSGTWLTDNGVGLSLFWDLGVGTTFSGAAGSWSGSNLFGLTSGTKLATTAGATFRITGVQLEAGSVATPFERRPYGTELALCQRYYIEVGVRNASGGDVFSLIRWGASLLATSFNTPVTMRATPTGTLTGAYTVAGNGTTPSLTAISSVTTVMNTGVAVIYSSSIDPSATQPYVALGSSSSVKTALSAEL